MENHFQCSVCTVIYIECMSLLFAVLMVESEMYINIFDITMMYVGRLPLSRGLCLISLPLCGHASSSTFCR